MAHKRKDFEYSILRGRGAFCPAAYAVIITQSTAYPDERCLYHIEFFYGQDGRTVRSEAMRYGRKVVTGKQTPGPYRNQHLTSGFHCPDLPKRENEVEIR
jgi:hypothetical protein